METIPQTEDPVTVDEAIQSWRVQPFARGSADCCAFADHVVEALTGKSYLPEYENDAETEAILQEHGGLSEAVTHWMGREPVCTSSLVPGDVVYVSILEHEAIGILATEKAVVTVFENGTPRVVPVAFVDHGWSIWA